MSFKDTDVDSLGKRISKLGFFKASGDKAVKLPENKESTNNQRKDESKYGDCYIFDYQKFGNNKALHRPGSEKDVKRLKEDFTNLDFNVDDYLNLSRQNTLDELEKIAKIDHKRSKCFVCCFLTHGDRDGVLIMGDNKILYINDILKLFSRSACKSLQGVPKIFIFQACRGGCAENYVLCDSIDGDYAIEIPDYLDFVLAFSTYEGKISFKTKDICKENNHGSFFIDEFCRTLEQFSKQLDFLQILTIVNYRMAHFFLSRHQDDGLHEKKQMPCFTSRLTTELQFNKEISMFKSSDTSYFDSRRCLTSGGSKSTKFPLEDKQTYRIRDPRKIKVLFLINKENVFLEKWAECTQNLWDSVSNRDYGRNIREDWSREELKNFLKTNAQNDFTLDTDCFICLIACQGNEDCLYDKDGKEILRKNIIDQFTGDVCSNLRGKPKIFIFLTSPLVENSSDTESTDGDGYLMIPVHSDLLEVAFTVQECHQLEGVTEKLCDIFGSSEDFLIQLTKMNRELVKDYGFYSLPDLSLATESSVDNLSAFSFSSTLTKTLILNEPKCT